MDVFKLLMDIVFPEPERCLQCDSPQNAVEIEGLCQECLKKFSYVLNYCVKCGRQVNFSERDKGQKKCNFCKAITYFFERARAPLFYRGAVQQIIADFKYHGKKELARPLGHLLSLYYSEYYKKMSIDVVMPVPLHKERERERGFNQARLLAEEMCRRLSLKLLDNLLIRKKNTPPLYNLSYRERKEAIKGVFSFKKGKRQLQGVNILLVDDIFTTGSTVNELGRFLTLKTGVNHIYVYTLSTADLIG